MVLFDILRYVHPRIPTVSWYLGGADHLSHCHRIQCIGVVAVKLGRCVGIVKHRHPRIYNMRLTKFTELFKG